MDQRKLEAVLEMHALTAYDGETPLLAAGPLFKQPGTMPYRIVIVHKDDKVIVYNEQVPKWPDSHLGSNFSSGDYFGLDKLPAAFQCFSERLSRQAEYAESMYRLVWADPPEEC